MPRSAHLPLLSILVSVGFLGAAALPASLAPSVASVPPPDPPEALDPPNVVVLMVDDARLDDMKTLPVVRSLIGDSGATFTSSVSPYPTCCPARATLLTGQYAHNHGVLGNDAPHGGFRAFDDRSTLATWLDQDYATAWVGKYMNQYSAKCCRSYVPPGWDSWRGALGTSYADYRGTQFNVDGRLVDRSGEYQTDVVTDYAVDFIDDSTARGEPFFLFTSYFAAHAGAPAEADDPDTSSGTFKTPNVADRHRDAFTERPLKQGPAFNESDTSDKPKFVKRKAPIRPWQVRAMTEVDQQRKESLLSAQNGVRRVVETLAASGELDNTYIVFTSDNGYLFGEHRLLDGKSLPYEPAVRVPLLIRGPGIEPGTVVEQPVGGHDVAPTVLSMTGQSGSQGDKVIDGLDLLELIENPARAADRPIVLERGPRTANDTVFGFHAIRTPQWKYVEYDTGERELYDLVDDPHELENLEDDTSQRATRRYMNRLLDQYAYCAGAQCRRPPAAQQPTGAR